MVLIFNTLIKKFPFQTGKNHLNLIPVSKIFFGYRCLIVKITLQTKEVHISKYFSTQDLLTFK